MSDPAKIGVREPASTGAPAQRGASEYRSALRLRLYDRNVQRVLINVGVILLIGLVVQVGTGKFFSGRNLTSLAIQIAVVTIIACAMTLVMVAGSIDISVSGVVVLSGVVTGQLIVSGTPMWLAFIAGTLVGVAVGLINSFLVIVLGITSLIATIGTLYASQGVANLLTNGLAIAGLPIEFSTLGSGYFWGVPIVLPIMAVTVAVFVGIQRTTRLGRHIVATGSNAQAAFLNGVSTRWTLLQCFVLSGAAAGWGGIIYASRLGNPAPVLDNDLLFQVIVAIVVGGTSLTGGEGSVVGTLTGAVLIGVVNQALNLFGVSTYWQYVALGLLLVISVGSDAVLRQDKTRDVFLSLRRQLDRQTRQARNGQRSSGGGSSLPRGGP